MENRNTFTIEIAYAVNAIEHVMCQIDVEPNTSVLEAIQQSGLLVSYPEIDVNTQKIGVFSRLVRKETIVQPNWRIEIYRPLLIDPKMARRRRV